MAMLSSISIPSSKSKHPIFYKQQQQKWLGNGRISTTTKFKRHPIRVSISSEHHLLIPLLQTDQMYSLGESTGYSLASYYTSLGLFVISVPGLWSLIKRSVKSKIVKKTFIGEGEEGKKAPNQVAGEIMSFFARNNFQVTDRGETIT